MNRLIARCVVVAALFTLLAQGRVAAQSSFVGAPRSFTAEQAPLTQPFDAPSIQTPSPAAKPFTPVMLGDFTGPLGSMFLDLKIAEGQSPRPMDRVYYDFNAFSNLNKDLWTRITQPIRRVDLYRSVFGMEKTFFDGQVSLGLRVPIYTLNVETRDLYIQPTLNGPVVAPGGSGVDSTHFGNISAVVKAILWEDKATGSLLSGGMTLTVPTASSTLIDPGPSLLAYVQPYGGFIINQGNFFTQGFVSLVMPIARPESIVFFADLGTGFWIYRNDNPSQLITGIAPTVEVHVTSPLRQPDPSIAQFGVIDNLRLNNVVNFTLGATVELSGRTTLGLGVVVPVTGPKPFDIEGIAQVNWRF
jgi:hypothetical protein